MVAKITHPKEDSIQVFEKIISERARYKDFYKSIKNDWLKNIESYIKHKGNPEHVVALDLSKYTVNEQEKADRKNSLIALYSPKKETKKTPYEILSKMRREHGLICCPSCGDAGTPGTLDHYLPKDKFPELSILLMNLTPMCSDCQLIKGTEYITEGGLKKYIHPYYDEVNLPLYYVIFKPPYVTPIFSIVINEELNEPLLSLVKEHINGIDLDTRFKRFCNTKYVHLLKMAKRNRDGSGTLETIINYCLQTEEDKAINCWEAVFYRSVLKDGNLREYLKNGVLPESF